jgi:hypothetical protein
MIIMEHFRKNFAGIGYQYDQTRDAFISPKPFNSWILNEQTCLWEAPVAKPTTVLEIINIILGTNQLYLGIYKVYNLIYN